MNFSQVWLEGEPCHCSCAYRAAHYSKTCSNYKRAGFSCWLLLGILIPGSLSHRWTVPHLTQGATADISFLLPVLVNMQWSWKLNELAQGKLRVTPYGTTHYGLNWGSWLLSQEGADYSLAHSFHEFPHGWVSTEIGNSSTMLAYVLCRIEHIFSVVLRPSPLLIPSGWQKQRSAQSADFSYAWAVRLLVLQFPVQGRVCSETVIHALNQHCKCFGNFEVKATSASWCVAPLVGAGAIMHTIM